MDVGITSPEKTNKENANKKSLLLKGHQES